MVKKYGALALAAAVLVGMVTVAGGGDTKGEVARGKGKGKYESKAKAGMAARTIDFASDLDLDFPSLRSLGVRIDSARLGVDPVALVLAAKELGVAEKVSGKTTKLKSTVLVKEGVEAALRRAQVKELKAVALLVEGDEDSKKKLEERITLAEKQAADRKKGEGARGVTGSVIVYNRTDKPIHIFINDQNVGHVHAFGSRSFYVGDSPDDTTKLYGRANHGTWGPLYKSGTVGTERWTLNP